MRTGIATSNMKAMIVFVFAHSILEIDIEFFDDNMELYLKLILITILYITETYTLTKAVVTVEIRNQKC